MTARSLRLVGVVAVWASLAAATMPPSTVSPIADAAMRGDVAAVRTLIARRADVNAAQGDGMTALHWAADRGDSAMASELLRAKANVAARTRINFFVAHETSKKSLIPNHGDDSTLQQCVTRGQSCHHSSFTRIVTLRAVEQQTLFVPAKNTPPAR